MRRMLFLIAAVLARNSKRQSKEMDCRDGLTVTSMESVPRFISQDQDNWCGQADSRSCDSCDMWLHQQGWGRAQTCLSYVRRHSDVRTVRTVGMFGKFNSVTFWRLLSSQVSQNQNSIPEG